MSDHLREHLRFFTTAVRSRNIGAIAASSPFVVARVLKMVPAELNMVIEYGPGTGVMTRMLIPRLSARGSYVAIEANEVFARTLSSSPDPRLRVVHGKAEKEIVRLQHEQTSGAELVITSMPFSLMSPEKLHKIVADTHSALLPGGSFISFHQYTPRAALPMKKIFGNVSVSFEVINLFPCFILRSKKM